MDARSTPGSMPPNWGVQAPTENDTWIVRLWLGVRSMMFQFLCLSAFGLPEIQAVHDKMQDEWDKFRDNTKEMLNQASIIVSNMKLCNDDSIDDLSGWAATHCHCGLSDDDSTTHFLILIQAHHSICFIRTIYWSATVIFYHAWWCRCLVRFEVFGW